MSVSAERNGVASRVFRGGESRVIAVSTDERSPAKKRARVKIRWWHILLLVILVAAFLGLAYWQWTRFQSGSGTFQNLGYALQWPLFAAFAIYAYRATIHYENQRVDEDEVSQTTNEESRIDEDFLPERPHVDVETFNEMNDPRSRRRHARDEFNGKDTNDRHD